MRLCPHGTKMGKEIAFVTWDEENGGSVYKQRVDKISKPIKMTQELGVYTEPVWSLDNRIVALKDLLSNLKIRMDQDPLDKNQVWSGLMARVLVKPN